MKHVFRFLFIFYDYFGGSGTRCCSLTNCGMQAYNTISSSRILDVFYQILNDGLHLIVR